MPRRRTVVEAEENAHPAFVGCAGDVGRQAHKIDAATDGLAGAEKQALAQAVVGAGGRGQVHASGQAPGRAAMGRRRRVMLGLREKLDKDRKVAGQVARYAGGATAVGGLAYCRP